MAPSGLGTLYYFLRPVTYPARAPHGPRPTSTRRRSRCRAVPALLRLPPPLRRRSSPSGVRRRRRSRDRAAPVAVGVRSVGIEQDGVSGSERRALRADRDLERALVDGEMLRRAGGTAAGLLRRAGREAHRVELHAARLEGEEGARGARTARAGEDLRCGGRDDAQRRAGVGRDERRKRQVERLRELPDEPPSRARAAGWVNLSREELPSASAIVC
jgi:hypothetical protein